ncbi:MAG: hypothetical protein CL663_08210 [Bacteroidetes bacterium]|nr:hypothetical protein [Bacteroidota bacterium]
MKRFIYLYILVLIVACTSGTQTSKEADHFQCVTLLGDTLFTPELKDSQALNNYLEAQKNYESNTDDPTALIWYGRRAAYLGQYKEAIRLFSLGIEKHPEDARFYRHRGHRYISTRQFELAISDLEKAKELTTQSEDMVEPDGLPNSKNIPLTTLKGNIFYHLALSYYLQNNIDAAGGTIMFGSLFDKYDDNIVSTAQWFYMTLRRMNEKKSAMLLLQGINKEMDIIENMSYHQMCLFYKGELTEDELKIDDVALYSLGNWYLYEKNDKTKAKEYWSKLLKEGNPYSFAYIACEADWARLFND